MNGHWWHKNGGAKHATVISFGKVLGELDFSDYGELRAWMRRTGFEYYEMRNMCAVYVTDKSKKEKSGGRARKARRSKSKDKNAE